MLILGRRRAPISTEPRPVQLSSTSSSIAPLAFCARCLECGSTDAPHLTPRWGLLALRGSHYAARGFRCSCNDVECRRRIGQSELGQSFYDGDTALFLSLGPGSEGGLAAR
jgi:hypothetical protein